MPYTGKFFEHSETLLVFDNSRNFQICIVSEGVERAFGIFFI